MAARSTSKRPRRPAMPTDLFGPPSRFDIKSRFTAAELRRTERVLGVRLPASYVAMLKVRNGGFLHRAWITPEQRPPRDVGTPAEYRIEHFAGIHRTHDDGLTSKWTTARREWDLPDDLVPFDGDGHDWVCLDYRECGPRGQPRITHILTSDWVGKPPREFRVAPSFDVLLTGLRGPKPGSGSAAIALDSPKVRGTKLAKTLRALGCRKHGWPELIYSAGGKPPAWEWPRYKGPRGREFALLIVEKNFEEISFPRFKSRAADHPILRVDTAPRVRSACVSALKAALGEHATVLGMDSHGTE